MSQALTRLLLAAAIAMLAAGCSSSSSDSDDDGDNGEPPENEVGVTPTRAGEILINEFMARPDALRDAEGEWFEVINPTDTRFNLRDCVFSIADTSNFIVDIDLEIDAGELRTFAISDMPGFTPDFNYNGAFPLNNFSDTLTLTCNGVTIDSHTYIAAEVASGRTSSLSSDGSGKWCLDRANIYFLGDKGTPGGTNVVCA